MTTKRIIKEKAILKVKNKSNKKAGNGKITMDKIITITTGAPKPMPAIDFIVSRVLTKIHNY